MIESSCLLGRSGIAASALLAATLVLSPTQAHTFSFLEGSTREPRQAPRSTTADPLAEQMLRLAHVTADDVVYDLGSRERIPIAAALIFGARGVGVGLEPSEAQAARKATLHSSVADRVSFIEGHLVTAKFSEATVVTLDLSPALNLILEPILRRELRPGARIVSHRYGIGAWRADETFHAEDGTMIFMWTVPRPPARTPDILFVPTPQHIGEQMLDLAGVTTRDIVYDLGSGDGRIVILAAQKYGARAVGVELDPALVNVSRQVARDGQVAGKVTFIEQDLFNVDVSDATVVTLFLSRSVNRRLAEKLQRELKAGSRVVSRQFDMGDWTPDRTVSAEDGTKLFLWTIRER